jgi:hypothetical protein
VGSNPNRRPKFLLQIVCLAGVLQLAFAVNAVAQRWTNALEAAPIIAAHLDPLSSTVNATTVNGSARQLNLPKQASDTTTVELSIPVRSPSHASTRVEVEPRPEPRETRLICDRAPPTSGLSVS